MNDTKTDLAATCAQAVAENGAPEVALLGNSGNAFSILGACRRAARKQGWSKDQVDALVELMTSGDYDALLRTAMTYLEVD